MKKVLRTIGVLSFLACFLLEGCLLVAAGIGGGAGYYLAKHSKTQKVEGKKSFVVS